ncbi:MAG: methyltransferase domain-containing protein [Dehalococcoidales bacterium]|nr:methyltransferase domain-containing protein [Dehalococcoidales bacterium]
MKGINLHLGCGPVYLEGWLNVDVCQEGYTCLASERKDLLEYNKTTIDRYYKYPFGKRKGDFVVVDQYLDLAKTPYPFEEESVNSILAVGVFEHFSRDEGIKLLQEWYRILVAGGGVLIDIPDLAGTFRLLENAKNVEEMNWAIRLIYGSQKNPFSFHKWGYTFETLSNLCKTIGFRTVERVNLIEHDYPMLMVRAVK